ncbi:hypothetical protein [Deinococcus taeanensis]|nr:hypothetical protein [Deinococcus taeanensis]
MPETMSTRTPTTIQHLALRAGFSAQSNPVSAKAIMNAVQNR